LSPFQYKDCKVCWKGQYRCRAWRTEASGRWWLNKRAVCQWESMHK